MANQKSGEVQLIGIIGLAAVLSLVACSREQKFDTKLEDGAAAQDAAGKTSEQASKGIDGSGGSGSPAGSIEGFGKQNPSDALANGEDTGAANSKLLSLPQDESSLKIDASIKDEFGAQEKLGCRKTFLLEWKSSNGEVTGNIDWKSTNTKILEVSPEGKATVVGFGKVTVVGVGTKKDGSKIQDNMEITIAPPQTGFKLTTPKGIAPLITASAKSMGNGEFSEVRDGLAQGVIRLSHPEKNIKISAVQILVHSTDFSNFVFGDFTEPKLDEATCLWFVDYSIKFSYLFVGENARYRDQKMQVEFTPEMKRSVQGVPLNAELTAEGKEGKKVELEGSGTQGFSPLRK